MQVRWISEAAWNGRDPGEDKVMKAMQNQLLDIEPVPDLVLSAMAAHGLAANFSHMGLSYEVQAEMACVFTAPS